MFIFIITCTLRGLFQLICCKKTYLIIPINLIILIAHSSVYNTIIARTYFQALYPKIARSASIDDVILQIFSLECITLIKSDCCCNSSLLLCRTWNSYFSALIYLNNSKYYPLQLILRSILIQSKVLEEEVLDLHSGGEKERLSDLIKYGVIIVSAIPLLIIYPWLQKYFVQGVMIGSVKG